MLLHAAILVDIPEHLMYGEEQIGLMEKCLVGSHTALDLEDNMV